MNFINRIERFFQRDLWAADSANVQGFARIYIPILRLLVVAVSDFKDGALNVRATGLVFTTLLSLVPFLAVLFSVLKGFEFHEYIEPILAQALEPLGPKGQEVTQKIMEFVSNLDVRVLGAVGVAGLFYTTFSLIENIEASLNSIWRVRHSRSLSRKFTDYISVVIVGPFLVFIAFTLMASAQSHWLVKRVLQIDPLGAAVLLATQLMPFLFLCFAFTFFYKFVPHTQVNLSSAMIGGVTAGILWQLAGMLFASVVASSVRYSAIYSSFAILILFLIWLYVSWLIVLVGSQIAYYHQHPAAYLTLVNWKQKTAAFREQLVLKTLVEMARRFYAGEPPSKEEDLARNLKVPFAALDEVIEDFLEYGFVNRTMQPAGVALGRPPEQITILEIIDVIRHRYLRDINPPEDNEDVITNILRRRDAAVRVALDGLTLKSLATGDGISMEDSEATSLFVGRQSS